MLNSLVKAYPLIFIFHRSGNIGSRANQFFHLSFGSSVDLSHFFGKCCVVGNQSSSFYLSVDFLRFLRNSALKFGQFLADITLR